MRQFSRQYIQSLDAWKQEFIVSAFPRDPATFPFVVLGNKIDLISRPRAVSLKKAQQWCLSKGGYSHFETSAADNINIDLAFETIARSAVKRSEQEEDLYVSIKPIRLLSSSKMCTLTSSLSVRPSTNVHPLSRRPQIFCVKTYSVSCRRPWRLIRNHPMTDVVVEAQIVEACGPLQTFSFPFALLVLPFGSLSSEF